jgi:glucosyl-dolichyl phosphate glucuronosyltransferase
MNITVILCTYNRCQSLPTALESIAVSEMPPAVSWEVLVVDNNSKDETRAVVERFIQKYPGRFRYLFEAKQGKSNALNSGIRESAGEILAFMDDDVVVDAKWLRTLASVLADRTWDGVGGRILPERDFVPPGWLSITGKYDLAPLALFDLGGQGGEMHEPPFGTNMAFRRGVFERLGGFRTDLGPCPGSEARSEDTEFGYRALAAKERLWYEPTALVYHSLDPARLTKKYFLAWWYDKARTDIKQDGIPDDLRQNLAGVPVVLPARLCLWFFRWILAVDPAKRFNSQLNLWRVMAMMRECYRLNTQNSSRSAETIPDVSSAPRRSAE